MNGAVPSQNCKHFSHGSQAIGRCDQFFLAGEGGSITVPLCSSSHQIAEVHGCAQDVHGASMCVQARATLVSDVKLDDALCLPPDAFKRLSGSSGAAVQHMYAETLQNQIA